MDTHPALQTFVAESRDLLREMESALLELERTPEHGDSVDAAFRAAHTIKGSAGVFDLEAVVELTHAMESVLVDVRSGDVPVTADLVALLLSCGDHISALLEACEAGDGAHDPEIALAGRTLVEQLASFSASGLTHLPEAASARPEDLQVESSHDREVESDTWHVSVRFDRDVLRNGMDPLATLGFLATLGRIESLTTLFDAMPEARAMDPESCYVGVELELSSGAGKSDIEAAFEFLREGSVIHILPPHSRVSEYLDLIARLPEDDTRLGELLTASGALTERELQQGLEVQRVARELEHTDQAADRIGEILVRERVVQTEIVEAALEKQKSAKERRSGDGAFLRVRADKLDELINLIGELVIASAGTSLAARRASDVETIEAAATMARLVEQVRDGSLMLRMVPIGETFNRFNRSIRDLGRELGKDVDLVLSGAETELDKSMVERISDPLMHLIRNAVDHGIEAPELRLQRGKPARGQLRLNAYHETGSIVVEVSDDGEGLNRNRILERAIELGLVTEGQPLADQDIHRLIMEPGFSTAASVTNVSGRGVGMDVVKRNVEALRGSIAIDSVEGEGTTVSLRLPMTLAIIDGFLVGIGKSSFVVPLDMVVECMEITHEQRASVSDSGFINLRGDVLPLLRLREVFDVQGNPAKRENIVVVQYGGKQAGFLVDALLGEFQTVIKPLGKLFEHLSGISGSTILGSGDVALILDVPALVQRAVSTEASRCGEAAAKLIESK